MFENISYFFKRMVKPEQKELGSKDAAKERLHLVLMQDRANVSADFLELMKQEIIDVIKKYIVVDESSIDVRLTNKSNDDGTTGAPALYANIPIVNIKNDMMAEKEKKFEGIDFNKEMGLVPDDEDEEELPPLEIEPIPGQEIEDNKTAIIENYNEETELEEDFIEDEEDDDDVTFDDLLKAAEEEDRKKEENNNEEEKESLDVIEEKIEINENNENEDEKIELDEKEVTEIQEADETEIAETKNDETEEKEQEDVKKKTRGRKKKESSEDI